MLTQQYKRVIRTTCCTALFCACRAAAADIELGGYMVPEGTLLFLSMGGMHTSPHNFLESHRFYPVS
jgi:cytochrome P450